MLLSGKVDEHFYPKLQKLRWARTRRTHRWRKWSNDNNPHIEMGLRLELEMMKPYMSACKTLRGCCILPNTSVFYVKNRARKTIDFCASVLCKVQRTMVHTCLRPTLTLRFDWNTFWSLQWMTRCWNDRRFAPKLTSPECNRSVRRPCANNNMNSRPNHVPS